MENAFLEKTEKLGDKLVRYKTITQKELDYALQICEQTNELLGMVLINEGLITQETLLKVMHLTGKRSRLGEILMRENLITRRDLDKALTIQQKDGRFLGEILIEQKKISRASYLKALSRNLNMPIKRIKGFIPRTTLSEILQENVSIMCENVVFIETPETLELVVSQPYDGLIDDLRILLPKREINIYLTYQEELTEAILRYTDSGSSSGVRYHTNYDRPEEKIDAPDSLKQAATRIINDILTRAVTAGASDIHIMAAEYGGIVKIRKDGRLQDLPISVDIKSHYPMIVSRIKILTNSMDITEKRVPQDGSFKATFFEDGESYDIDFRVATVLSGYGENITIRILDQNQKLTNLENLGFSETVLDRYNTLLNSTEGMILISGPTGSGKTSTLYATINALLKRFPAKKIMTAEDPIEFRYDGEEVSQSQLLRARGLDFAGLLRSFLRHDPDILLVGEIRDTETAEMAIKCVQTGHFLLSTLHTPNTTGTIERLKYLGVNPGEFLSVTKGIIGQRLLPRLCPDCIVKQKVPQKTKKQYFGKISTSSIGFVSTKGCASCQMMGLKGRVPLVELWTPSDEERIEIHELALPSVIRQNAIRKGLHTFYGDGILKLKQKMTTVEHLIEHIPSSSEDRDFYEENPEFLPK